MYDYIIIGCGLGGIAFCEKALQQQKSFIVLDNPTENSSKIAAGLYNPVILKRFSQVWHAQEQLNLLTNFYIHLETKLNVKLDYKLPILRKLFSIEEQNNWFIATDKPKVGTFLSPKLLQKNYPFLQAPFGFGEVHHTGYVDTKQLLLHYQKYLQKSNSYLHEQFDYQALESHDDYVQYKNIKAKHIIFAEGFGVRYNPYFNHLPVDGTKGELLIIDAPDLQVNDIINSSIYIIPIGEHKYKVGATYNWDDKTNEPTENGKNELLENIQNIINCDYKIVAHTAGIRPTVKDRRPLVGTHPEHNRFHILNGLGTRGVMLAPEMAHHLFEHIENNIPLDDHIDIKRYDKCRFANQDCI